MLSLTGTLFRVAFEYGHTWWALSTSDCASADDNPGSPISIAISRPKPPSERGPMPTVAVTDVSCGTFGPPRVAAANNCSGLLPAPPAPPNSFGVASLMSQRLG